MRQLNLRQFIYELEKHESDTEVRFDFGAIPDGFDSYRGYYEQLALNYKNYEREAELKVGDLLAQARETVGKEFMGYKGGDYVMYSDTLLWASNHGECSRMAIVGVENHDWIVIINTWFMDS